MTPRRRRHRADRGDVAHASSTWPKPHSDLGYAWEVLAFRHFYRRRRKIPHLCGLSECRSACKPHADQHQMNRKSEEIQFVEALAQAGALSGNGKLREALLRDEACHDTILSIR